MIIKIAEGTAAAAASAGCFVVHIGTDVRRHPFLYATGAVPRWGLWLAGASLLFTAIRTVFH